MIYFIGGCHVLGYPFGIESSFTKVFSSISGIDANVFDKPVSIKNSINAIKKCFSLPNKNDTLILQLGNFEGSFNTRPNFIKKIKRKSEALDHNIVNKSHRKSLLISAANYFFRMQIFWIYKVCNFSFFNKKCMQIEINLLFEYLAKNFPGKVYILSTFPTQDYATNFHRREMSVMLKTSSGFYGFDFIDVYAALSVPDVFFDVYHLNENGHKILGNLLTKYIN